MADEEEEVVEEKPKKDKTVLILVFLSILVMILTPVITIMVMKNFFGPADKVTVKGDKQPVEIVLPDIQTNVFGTQGTKFVMIKVAVTVADEKMRKYFEAQTAELPDGQQQRIIAEVNKIVSNKPLEGLLSAEAKAKLGEEIKGRLNTILSEHTDALIVDVYFPHLIVN